MSQQRAVQAQATGKAASPHAIKPRTPVGPMHPILTLNRTIGNKAVQRMIASQKTVSPAAEGYEQRFPATLSIDQVVGRGLNTLGHPLGRDTREFMENKFGFDFGDVRIHNDSHAAESSEAINADRKSVV